MEPNQSQALDMINGSTANGKIAQGKFVAKCVQQKMDSAAIIEDMYIRCLTRKPTKPELDRLLALVNEKPEDKGFQQQVLEDIFWSLLNSREFLFNH